MSANEEKIGETPENPVIVHRLDLLVLGVHAWRHEKYMDLKAQIAVWAAPRAREAMQNVPIKTLQLLIEAESRAPSAKQQEDRAVKEARHAAFRKGGLTSAGAMDVIDSRLSRKSMRRLRSKAVR